MRELIAGGSGAKLSAARFAPRLADLYMERWTFDSQQTARPTNGRAGQPVRAGGATTAASAGATGTATRGSQASTRARSCTRDGRRDLDRDRRDAGRRCRSRRPASKLSLYFALTS